MKPDIIAGEFWTSAQRKGNPIHEIPYRACFKPQLPAYFIDLYTKQGDSVYDPFSGRGTTALESALRARKVYANDVNPLSENLIRGRLAAPSLNEIAERLEQINFFENLKSDWDLSMFFHPKTLNEILSYKKYFSEREQSGKEDGIDKWIKMVATTRLTGHSTGFFSVYTLPPNQAVSPLRQIKINTRLNQSPTYRDTKNIILKKSKSLLSCLTEQEIVNLQNAYDNSVILCNDAANTPQIPKDSISLIVTSPPFLNVVQYQNDNWLRCWFNNIDADTVGAKITMESEPAKWLRKMTDIMQELWRVLKPGGIMAFETGEVGNRTINLDELAVCAGEKANFTCIQVLINSQNFTKTSNIWGITNNRRGTNSNRIAVFRK